MFLKTELFRTATFRTASLAVGAFGASTLLLFLFIYWQTAVVETASIDSYLRHESLAITRKPPTAISHDVATRYATDLRRLTSAAIFTPQHTRLLGDIAAYPEGLPVDAAPRQVIATHDGRDGTITEPVRAVARTLSDGRLLVLLRGLEQVTALRKLVVRAMELGLLPALLSALAIGILASRRTLLRLQRVNDTIDRIMQGNLGERLEHRPTNDAFDQLARGVNRMLDEIERLLAEVKGVGDDIAHDLRTPLTRVRARLEGARTRATTQDELIAAIDHSITDLDQTFATMTALLRIGEIEGGARRAGFAPVSLTAIAREVFELYQPVAELRDIALSLSLEPDLMVQGDRDLLFEVAANLLDNAVKFTPPAGQVILAARQTPRGPVLSVRDTGPGIPPAEQSAVLKRFHRADRTRHAPGHGLGLSLVAAILRLHLFHLHMEETRPGLLVEMRTWNQPS